MALAQMEQRLGQRRTARTKAQVTATIDREYGAFEVCRSMFSPSEHLRPLEMLALAVTTIIPQRSSRLDVCLSCYMALSPFPFTDAVFEHHATVMVLLTEARKWYHLCSLIAGTPRLEQRIELIDRDARLEQDLAGLNKTNKPFQRAISVGKKVHVKGLNTGDIYISISGLVTASEVTSEGGDFLEQARCCATTGRPATLHHCGVTYSRWEYIKKTKQPGSFLLTPLSPNLFSATTVEASSQVNSISDLLDREIAELRTKMSSSSSSSQSYVFSSVSSSSTTTMDGNTSATGHRSVQQSHTDPSGHTTMSSASQNLGEPVMTETRRFDGQGRELLDASGGASQNRIEDVSEAEQRERDREYEERIEDEYAKREGGA
nr:hypothetical protein CFP56_55970 [Quercus suber]